jgi:hypothetical protein
MAELINLRAVKKARIRADARAKGDENAAKFGQSKAEKDLARAQALKSARDLDGAKRE